MQSTSPIFNVESFKDKNMFIILISVNKFTGNSSANFFHVGASAEQCPLFKLLLVRKYHQGEKNFINQGFLLSRTVELKFSSVNTINSY